VKSEYVFSVDTLSDHRCLETLYIGYNSLSGPIPSYLSNCSKLVKVDFDTTLFSVPMPKSTKLKTWY
jgi:hypothetical protein